MTYQDYQKQQSALKDIKDFKYPVLKDADIIFSVMRTNTQLLELARSQGFYNGHTPYNDLASKLFFSGGTINYKKDLDPERKTLGYRYLCAVLKSFEPSHNDKEAIAALVLSELAEV